MTVDQYRKDWMIKGGCRNLDIPLILQPPVRGNDLTNSFLNEPPQCGLVFFTELSSLFDEIFWPAVVVHPRKGPPHLNVANILIGECVVARRIATAFIKLEVSWERLQHRANGDGKESLGDQIALFVCKLIGGFESELKRSVLRFASPVLFKLHD